MRPLTHVSLVMSRPVTCAKLSVLGLTRSGYLMEIECILECIDVELVGVTCFPAAQRNGCAMLDEPARRRLGWVVLKPEKGDGSHDRRDEKCRNSIGHGGSAGVRGTSIPCGRRPGSRWKGYIRAIRCQRSRIQLPSGPSRAHVIRARRAKAAIKCCPRVFHLGRAGDPSPGADGARISHRDEQVRKASFGLPRSAVDGVNRTGRHPAAVPGMAR